MEKIKIGVLDQLYEIASIMPVLPNVLQVAFTGAVPAGWGDITIYTEDGTEAATLTGYGTVYRDEGQTVYLSSDGSVYEPPEETGGALPPEPYVPTLAELQAAKKQEIAAACEQVIYAGVNVTLEDGSVEHYSLTGHDQLNLFGKLSQISAGAMQLEYHADGKPCQYYTAADMQRIVQAAMWHVSYHTTYCNALNMWVAGTETEDEVSGIFYGADVPDTYQSDVLQSYLTQIAALTGGDGGGTDPA